MRFLVKNSLIKYIIKVMSMILTGILVSLNFEFTIILMYRKDTYLSNSNICSFSIWWL